MKPEELDEIFQIVGSVPVIAGLYIGMEEEKAEEKIEELNSYKTELSSEYPLIYKHSISFEYDLFEIEYLVKAIRLVFPHECSKKDSDFIFDYLSKRIYHEKTHYDIETTSEGDLLHLNVDVTNYYYNCSYFNKEGHFVVQLSGIISNPELYRAFYITGSNADLKSFIHASLSFGSNEMNKDKNLDYFFHVFNGLPTVCGIYIGFNACSSSEAEQIIYDELRDSGMYNRHHLLGYISFEIMIDPDNTVDKIIMRISEKDMDLALDIIDHFKKRLLIEKAHYYLADGYEHSKIYVSMSNDYLSIMAKNPYRPSTESRDIEITIEATKKDRSDLYKTLYVMLSDKTRYDFFKEADVFYGYDNENNFSPVGAYDSYEEAIEAFQGD